MTDHSATAALKQRTKRVRNNKNTFKAKLDVIARGGSIRLRPVGPGMVADVRPPGAEWFVHALIDLPADRDEVIRRAKEIIDRFIAG